MSNIERVVAQLNQAAETVESWSGQVMIIADKVTDFLDGFSEALVDAASKVADSERSEPDAESGGTEEETSPIKMYNYLWTRNPSLKENYTWMWLNDEEELKRHYELMKVLLG